MQLIKEFVDFIGSTLYGGWPTAAGQRASRSPWRTVATVGTPAARRAPSGPAAHGARPPAAAPRHDAGAGPAAARARRRLRARAARAPRPAAAARRAAAPARRADSAARPGPAARDVLGQRRAAGLVAHARIADRSGSR